MKILKLISRIFLGIVFTFSGFVKAVDPHGSEYKFTDYFVEAFKLPSMSSLSLFLGITMAAFEFLVGICLLMNVKPRLSSIGALIFMGIFTPLTLYLAIFSPVKDCGCFGDAIKLSNWETFYKNLVLLPMAIFLFIVTKGEHKTYKGFLDWILTGTCFFLILFFQFYSLAHLPVIDFMPYKLGVNIPEKMLIPANEKADEYAVFYTMKHKKTGATKELSDAEFLKQWTEADSVWEIISTSEPKLIKKGYTPPIYNFNAYPIDLSHSGLNTQQDVMGEILKTENYCFLVISYDIKLADIDGFDKMAPLLNYAYTKQISAHFLTSSTSGLEKLAGRIHFNAKYYNTDAISLKMVIRSNPGLVLLKKGKIIGKWHYNDIPTIKEFEEIINKN
jgi:uncharacterized membrane protein YphA (DoxX/SURF4 family)